MKLKNYFVPMMLLLLVACKKELEPIETTLENTETFNLRADKPNIILAVIDDMGTECLGVSGGKSYSTPNIDKIAKMGLRFTNCFSTPLCSPSRTMLLTGKLGFRNYSEWGVLSRTEKTIANIMKAGGYATGVFGKWQIGGGDTSIRAFGFDEWCVHNAFEEGNSRSRYRNPYLFTPSGFIPDSLTSGKYGDDMVLDSLVSFLRRNSNSRTPSFSYYALMLAHKPFQPTPDDPNFSTWDLGKSDTTYYPSMIRYMDKVIGRLKDSIARLGLNNSTMLIITADNGTPAGLHSIMDTIIIPAGKGKSTLYGTHVPLIISWNNHIKTGIDSALIGFQDFLPTIADVAKLPYLSIVDTTDGISFYHNIVGIPGDNRQVLYHWFNAHPEDDWSDTAKGRGLITWVQDTRYKMYDSCTTPSWRSHLMFNMYLNPLESNDIPFTPTTPYELATKDIFINTLNYYKK